MRTFSDLYVSGMLFATLLSATSSGWLRGGGAGSRPRCSIHIGPSCTTCAAPARNGERSTPGTQAE
jgi:hypothetical protein